MWHISTHAYNPWASHYCKAVRLLPPTTAGEPEVGPARLPRAESKAKAWVRIPVHPTPKTKSPGSSPGLGYTFLRPQVYHINNCCQEKYSPLLIFLSSPHFIANL
jgi:hypothetical protein